MSRIAVDTSVAVPLLLGGHPSHSVVLRWASDRDLVLAGHAEVETFAVLTRLPDRLRVDAATAWRAIEAAFGASAQPLDPPSAVRRIASHGIGGGAVYDALVAIAADDADLTLATRDARAIPTYARIGVRVELVP